MERKPIKKKRCKVCKEQFTPSQTTQRVCSPLCAIKLTAKKKAEKQRREHVKHKREFYLKDRPTQLKLAQKEFNAFIRERDKAQPCISCGRYHTGQNHAGHYRSVGAAPHLRFNQFNVNLQCAPCNNHKSGNITEYRINLVKKFGQAKVDEIENNNKSANFSLDDVISIKVYYRKLTRELQRRYK